MLACNIPDNERFLRHVPDRALPGYHYLYEGLGTLRLQERMTSRYGALVEINAIVCPSYH
jgi:hypothetical protein